MKKLLALGVSAAFMSAATVPAQAAYAKCSQFSSQKEAQAYFDAKKRGYKSLDRDHDGIACEALK